MTRHVIVVVAPLSAFILFHATQGGLAQEQACALAASKLGGQELSNQKSSSQPTTLAALGDVRATDGKSGSWTTPVSTSSARPAALSETHAEKTGGPTGGVVVRSAKQGDGSCTVFDNQADFEASIEEEGKLLKGIEDFEESTLPPADLERLDDPLCGGVPNSPDAFPYPNGLDQLNMCVQSNTLGGTPSVPSPRGLAGLAAASAGFLGAVSDVVLSNQFVDSYDIMLISPPVTPGEEDDHTGVGFNTLDFLGGNGVDIRVYNKDNALLISDTSPADPAGSNFWGVWCADPIGRINVYDPAGGAEGADNIQLWDDFGPGANGDECEDCLSIDPNAAVNGTTADNTGATGDDTSCTFNDEIDEWYCYTACATGLALASTGGSAYDTALAVFDACGGNELGCSDDACGLHSQVTWAVTEGETYHVRVSGFDNQNGDTTLLITQVCESGCKPTGAENDCCADAIEINCGDTDYDTTGANTDGPGHPDDCQFDGQTYHDIWYEHKAALSGDLTVSTCSQADYGTDLVVYDGCDCGDLVLLDCNDDFPGCAGFSSEVTVPVVAGNCYLVRLGGWGDGDMGTATVTLSGEACGGPVCGSCPTDVDGSGDTGAADLAVLLGSWGPCAPGEECACLDGNDDGTIGAEDLAVLLGAWGPCP